MRTTDSRINLFFVMARNEIPSTAMSATIEDKVSFGLKKGDVGGDAKVMASLEDSSEVPEDSLAKTIPCVFKCVMSDDVDLPEQMITLLHLLHLPETLPSAAFNRIA